MQYKRCASCGLNLPISIMEPIKVNNNGRIMVVGICSVCKQKKINEAKEKKC